jgi:hypothetical protein
MKDTYGFAIRATAVVAFICGLVAGIIFQAVS